MDANLARHLAAYVATTQKQLDGLMPNVIVNGLAIRALLMTHPDPGSFARAFEDMYEGRHDIGDAAKTVCDQLAAQLVGLAKQLAALRQSDPDHGATR